MAKLIPVIQAQADLVDELRAEIERLRRERDELIAEKQQSSWGEFQRLTTLHEAAEAEVAKLREILSNILRSDYDGHGLTDCIDNDGKHYQSADLARWIEAAEACLAQPKEGQADAAQ